jgi:uncharacterized protein (DUF1800 family)
MAIVEADHAKAPVGPSGERRPRHAYTGPFGLPQANRLLNRAGFGPRPGEAAALVATGLLDAVHSLTRPRGKAKLSGPKPTDGKGRPIRPETVWGHDHLWWLDRMVRSDQQLVERMALVLHDWFATSEGGVSRPRQMMDQSNLFRERCFGSFLDLFHAVAADPAMLQWLSNDKNVKRAPNENFAREMMELFSLGADRGAYSEHDVREQARSLTGWTFEESPKRGVYGFHIDPRRHDHGRKTVFGRTGNWNWEDAVRLCVENPKHPSFFVEKLWSYFVGAPPSQATLRRLVSTYLRSHHGIRPVLEEILLSPEFYEGPPMVKPPVVHLASMLRAVGRGVDTTAWIELCAEAGQLLFHPPNVAGWDDTRWLDTARMRARWNIVDEVIGEIAYHLDGPSYSETETAEEAVARAIAAWGGPEIRADHAAELLGFAQRTEGLIAASGRPGPYRGLRQNALLQLIGVSPELVLQ